jgi:hypothetical protein
LSLLLALAVLPTGARAASVAATPPMGWNSWDAYGFTIDETEFRANAAVLAEIASAGWRYAVIDEGWYMRNPLGDRLATRDYLLDGFGRTVPVPTRFPSATGGAGFKPLADWVHARGLKFGIHIVRGIPKQAVQENAPIAGSGYHAIEAADTADTCGWDDGNFGVRDSAAGQAYYDSVLALYAGWGVDFLKVDCIADHPYKPTEIRQIATAIARSGRPIVLSLSPGPAQLSHVELMASQAQMWRISDDVWDGWSFSHERPGETFPNGVSAAFDTLAQWAAYARPGNWPDADMLPIGELAPHPGWGDARTSRLTPEEQRTQLTLWAIARSPLILGANLTRLDAATRALITHRAVLELNQQATSSHELRPLPPALAGLRIWTAEVAGSRRLWRCFAFFNPGDQPATLRVAWQDLGLASGRYRVGDLWADTPARFAERLELTLPAHGSAIYRVEAR